MNYIQVRADLHQRIRHGSVQDLQLVLDVFRFQYDFNPVYHQYVDLINIRPSEVTSVCQIPFLPIGLFKNHIVKTGDWQAETVFFSSRTGGTVPSRHFIRSLDDYHNNTLRCFMSHYQHPSTYCFFALLPSYLEQGNSSLVHMVKYFINSSDYTQSGFYKNDLATLVRELRKNMKNRVPTILIGVSYALLDLAEQYPMDLNEVIIMETGGMKGRRKEMTKAGLHQKLTDTFGVEHIHSEYGMTELYSQSYAVKAGRFCCPDTLQISISSVQDPLEWLGVGAKGQIHIIDLANLDSCAFIRTDDYGLTTDDGSFKVLGRLDGAEQRGCNLMV